MDTEFDKRSRRAPAERRADFLVIGRPIIRTVQVGALKVAATEQYDPASTADCWPQGLRQAASRRRPESP
jgi:hypothetical protein